MLSRYRSREKGSWGWQASGYARLLKRASAEPTVEVWISDFDKDIYGKKIRVSFLHRLRDELKFESADQLVSQMDQDKKMMNEYATQSRQ